MFHASSVRASVLFFNPQNEITVEEGESVVVEARLDTEGKSVNAVDAILAFPSNTLEAVDVSCGDSAIKIWITEPAVDNVAGTIRFTGGIPNGATFPDGLLARVTFLAKTPGNGTLSWAKSSQALLNDGQGTPDAVHVLDTPINAVPAVTGVPKISSASHPSSSAWYRDTTLVLTWAADKEALYSYVLDHSAVTKPDETADTPAGDLRFDGSIKYTGLSEGVYYFHLREGVKKNGAWQWSPTRTFRAQIDTTLPQTLSGTVGSDPTVYGGKLFAAFAGADDLSGIDRYDVWEAGAGWVENVKAPYELRDQGKTGAIRIRAVDKAGNMKEITVEVPKQARSSAMRTYLTLSLGLVLLIVAGVWKYWKS